MDDDTREFLVKRSGSPMQCFFQMTFRSPVFICSLLIPNLHLAHLGKLCYIEFVEWKSAGKWGVEWYWRGNGSGLDCCSANLCQVSVPFGEGRLEAFILLQTLQLNKLYCIMQVKHVVVWAETHLRLSGLVNSWSVVCFLIPPIDMKYLMLEGFMKAKHSAFKEDLHGIPSVVFDRKTFRRLPLTDAKLIYINTKSLILDSNLKKKKVQ